MRFLHPSIQYTTTADMAGLLDTTSKRQQEEKNEGINKRASTLAASQSSDRTPTTSLTSSPSSSLPTSTPFPQHSHPQRSRLYVEALLLSKINKFHLLLALVLRPPLD